MKPVFCFLATLVLTVDAVLQEYYEVAYKSIYLGHRWVYHIDAELINSQYQVPFKPSEIRLRNVAVFELAANPDPTMLTMGQADPDCGYYLGVRDFGFNKIYYNITRIEITSTANRFPTIYLGFNSVGKTPFELIVPMFGLNEEDESKSPEELMAWGEEYEVETVSPLTTDHLEKLSSDPHPVINIKFDWLKRLLSYGIHLRRTPEYDMNNLPIVTYTTRPLVLKQRFFDECDHVLARFRRAPWQPQ